MNQTYDATDARTAAKTFNFETNDDEGDSRPTVYVDETYVNRYNTERAFLDGATYDAKEIIKFDWETSHHKFDGNSKRWEVDADALDELAERLDDAGFDFDDGLSVETDGPLHDLARYAEKDDHVTVEYAKKNGNGNAVREGVVRLSGDNYGDDEMMTDPVVTFTEEDGRMKRVKLDDSGKPSIFSRGYAPYMGALVSVTVEK